jgi:hypothetical protein
MNTLYTLDQAYDLVKSSGPGSRGSTRWYWDRNLRKVRYGEPPVGWQHHKIDRQDVLDVIAKIGLELREQANPNNYSSEDRHKAFGYESSLETLRDAYAKIKRGADPISVLRLATRETNAPLGSRAISGILGNRLSRLAEVIEAHSLSNAALRKSRTLGAKDKHKRCSRCERRMGACQCIKPYDPKKKIAPSKQMSFWQDKEEKMDSPKYAKGDYVWANIEGKNRKARVIEHGGQRVVVKMHKKYTGKLLGKYTVDQASIKPREIQN